MSRKFPLIGLLAFACSASSCIEFKEQTTSYRYAAATDELRIFQDYRGIFGADDAEGNALSADEQADLDSVLGTERTFFFNNWIFEIDKEALKTYRKELKDPNKGDLAVADRPPIIHLLDVAIKNVSIKNGSFYFDADGQLCGVQSVKIAKFSEIVAAVNACTTVFLQTQANEEDCTPADKRAIARFLGKKDAKLAHQDGNALSVTWPMSRATFEKNFGAGVEDPARLKEIRDAGIGIKFDDDVTTFSVGKKDDTITEITLGFSSKPYTTNAVGPVRKKRKIEQSYDAKSAAKTSLNSRAK